MVRIDMSEYQERHTVSRLVGAPPATWVTRRGAADRGGTAQAVLRRPLRRDREGPSGRLQHALQVLDDGRLTDAQGRTVDFRNTVIIMTSNIGSRIPARGRSPRAARSSRRTRDASWTSCAQRFRPEFLNRVDDIVLFKPLTLPEIERIVELLIDELRQRISERGVELSRSPRRPSPTSPTSGYDPVYGARPLRRYIAHEVENRIGRALLSAQVGPGTVIRIDAGPDGLIVTFDNPSGDGGSDSEGKR